MDRLEVVVVVVVVVMVVVVVVPPPNHVRSQEQALPAIMGWTYILAFAYGHIPERLSMPRPSML